MKKEKYSEEFRAQALRKVYGRGRTIRSIADELNIFTLTNWIGNRKAVIVERRPQAWSLEERLVG